MAHIVDKIDRSNTNPSDPRNREVVYAAWGDSQIGNLETPINASGITRAFINNLPAYRKGLSPLRRGVEVGLAHGYWLLGPFITFNPLRDSSVGSITGLLAAIGTILIATITISLYAASDPPQPTPTVTTPNPPQDLGTAEGWNEYATGFFIGGAGGAIFAYALLTNIELFRDFLHFRSIT